MISKALNHRFKGLSGLYSIMGMWLLKRQPKGSTLIFTRCQNRMRSKRGSRIYRKARRAQGMSLEGPIATTVLTPFGGFLIVVKFGLLLLAVLYFIFSLIVVRQVSLMTDTLMTEVAPLIRAFSIIHAGLALGIILLFIGLLFG